MGAPAVRAMRDVRTAHGWLCALIMVAVVAQFLLAGAAAFGAISFDAHTVLGWSIAGAALLGLSLAALGRDEVLASGALFIAVAIQVALGALGTHLSAWFGSLHAVNALVMLFSVANLTRRVISQSPIARSVRVARDRADHRSAGSASSAESRPAEMAR